MSTTAAPAARRRTWTRRIDRWLFEPAPPARLATFRILTGLFAVMYLLVRCPALLSMGGDAYLTFEPVGVLWWLEQPLGRGAVLVLVLATILLGVAFTLGIGFRVSGPLFAVGLLVVTTYHSSGGQLLWFENLMVLHTLVVGCSRAADARAATRRGGRVNEPDLRYGWPLRLAAVVTVVTYVLAGVAKLRVGGLGWLSGESLRNHVAFSAARLRLLGGSPSPVGAGVVSHVWLFAPAAVASVIIELAAPLALLSGRVRWAWAIAAWAMHVTIAVTMYVVFPYPMSFVAFAPFFALEVLPLRWRRDAVGP